VLGFWTWAANTGGGTLLAGAEVERGQGASQLAEGGHDDEQEHEDDD